MSGKNELAISVDIGGTFIKGALINIDGNIIKKQSTPTGTGLGKESVIGNIISLIDSLIDRNNKDSIEGIGIGVPGCIDTKTGTIKAGIANVPELKNVCLSEELGKHFKYKIFVDNDATNAAKGEFLFGAGKELKNIIVVTLGTGIGGGIILNGLIYKGNTDYAGEIGHMNVVPDGRPCSCGNLGCIEAYSSGTAMVNAALHKKHKGVDSKLNSYTDNEITPKLIEELAEQGDSHSNQIIYEAGKYLGICLASVTNLLNLQSCIIGGGISNAGHLLYDPMNYYFHSYVLPEAGRDCPIVKAKLKNDAGILGCAAMVFMEKE